MCEGRERLWAALVPNQVSIVVVVGAEVSGNVDTSMRGFTPFTTAGCVPDFNATLQSNQGTTYLYHRKLLGLRRKWMLSEFEWHPKSANIDHHTECTIYVRGGWGDPFAESRLESASVNIGESSKCPGKVLAFQHSQTSATFLSFLLPTKIWITILPPISTCQKPSGNSLQSANTYWVRVII